MITFPREFPTDIPIAKARFGLDRHNATARGFNQNVSVQVHAGGLNDRWTGAWTTAVLTDAQHRFVTAWVMSLQDRLEAFLAYDPDRRTSSQYTASARTSDDDTITCDADTVNVDVDSLPGVGFVNGDQTGRTLASKGWNNSANLFNSGDFKEIAGHLYMAIEDSASDGSGNASHRVIPNLKNVLDNTPIFTRNPVMKARLSAPFQGYEVAPESRGSISFAFEEVL